MAPERPYEDDYEEDEDEIQPGDPDYDLSEAHGYMWDPAPKPFPPRWLIVTVTIVVIAALVVPSVLIVLQYT
jgi:hypothetical protein